MNQATSGDVGDAAPLPQKSALDAAVSDGSSSEGEGSSPKCPICLLKLRESNEVNSKWNI